MNVQKISSIRFVPPILLRFKEDSADALHRNKLLFINLMSTLSRD